MGFLIDTHVLSELRKGLKANAGVKNRFEIPGVIRYIFQS